MQLEVFVGIMFIIVAAIVILIIRAKMTSPIDYSDAVGEVINRTNDDVIMRQQQEFIARQDDNFRSSR